MKNKSEVLEQMYAKKLTVLRDPNSTLEQVIVAYNANPEEQPENTEDVHYWEMKSFRRRVVKPEFVKRIIALLGQAKTFDEAFKALKVLPRKDTLRKQAAERVLHLANCSQALTLYGRVHGGGKISTQILNKAFQLAKTQNELWQVAIYLRNAGKIQLWKQAVEKIASKVK